MESHEGDVIDPLQKLLQEAYEREMTEELLEEERRLNRGER